MSFFRNVNAMIERFGNDVLVTTGEKEYSTKAFLQPLRYKSQFVDKVSFGGKVSEDFFLYIGKADTNLCAKTPSIVLCGEKKYVVHNTHNYVFNNKTLYVWAVLRPYYEKRRDDYATVE